MSAMMPGVFYFVKVLQLFLELTTQAFDRMGLVML